jgi:nucleotide-binding universal stress UspA family protein
MQFGKILIAIDDSAFSLRAAEAGFTLARSLGAEVSLVFVVNRSKQVVNADIGITPAESRNILLQEADKTIDQFVRMFGGGSKVYRFTPEGLPEKEIVNMAREWGADLIVLGTHARSGLQRILTGSVAEYVIWHARVPVMVAPPGMEPSRRG